jgi:hypothetical protein
MMGINRNANRRKIRCRPNCLNLVQSTVYLLFIDFVGNIAIFFNP